MISVSQALSKILASAINRTKESLPLTKNAGRVLAEQILAPRDFPPFDRATMDGIAVCEQKPIIAGQEFLIVGEIQAGDDFQKTKKLKKNEALWIMTGAALMGGATRVIPKESLQKKKDKVQVLNLSKNRYFASKGQDIKKGQAVLTFKQVLDERSLAFCNSLGAQELKVFAAPRIAILSTGNEVVACQKTPKNYQITDINASLLEKIFQKKNIPYQNLGIVRDEEKLLREKISEGLQYDIFLISGGVSAGKYDFVPQILQDLGVQKIFHKVLLKPGKPLWYGRQKNTAVFGLPGNPVSVQVCYKIFIEPYIKHFLGYSECKPIYQEIPWQKVLWQKPNLLQKESPLLETYYPARKKNNGLLEVIPFQSSGDFISLLSSDGLVKFLTSKQPNQAPAQRQPFLFFLPWNP